ncbi:hypothetical protein [Thiohalorhabdus methylotrophus]|uniref:Uncharacterized protein n=1 Tax=Thiohalorhabdus methylotrophus TaxID=3242694 RepID=A0ABV4TYG6_9GAMM
MPYPPISTQSQTRVSALPYTTQRPHDEPPIPARARREFGAVFLSLLLASCGGDAGSGNGQDSAGQGSDSQFSPEGPAGTWLRQDPQAEPGEPEYRPYSGITAGNGYVYYWGGGHKTHGGNDVDAYDIAANEWGQLTEEENWENAQSWLEDEGWYPDRSQSERQQLVNRLEGSRGGGWEVDIRTPRGRPVTKHSYAQMAWWPGHGYCLLKQRFWCYDPQEGDADGAWTDLGPDPFEFGNSGTIAPWNLAYDRELDTVVTVVGTRETGKVYVYDTESGSWRTALNNIQYQQGEYSEVYSAHDPETDWHIVFANQKWQRINAATGEIKSMAQLRYNGQVVKGSFSIEWAPELGKALVAKRMDGQLRMWAYDPQANQWSDFQLEGTGPDDAHAQWDTLARDPRTGMYVFLAKADESAEEGETPTTWTFWLRSE